MNAAGLSGVPGWLWLVTGVAAGFFVAFLFRDSPDRPVVEGEAGQPELVQKNTHPTPVFDFYTLLPESEVVVGDREKPLVVAEKPQKKDTTAYDKVASVDKKETDVTESKDNSKKMSALYLLQAGSFRSLKDADRLRAQLLLWGLNPRVERVSVGEGEYWHRVQVGPFSNKQALDSARQTLADNKVDTLLLKMK